MIQADSPFLIPCEACGKATSVYGTIKLGTIDPTRKYRSSHRKMLMNYKWRLCPKHYSLVLKTINEAIEKI